MRTAVWLSVLTTVPVALSAQQCGETSPIPVITSIDFPPEIRGDGTLTGGKFTVTDGDGGMRYATLSSVVCPTGYTCPDANLDLTEFIPDIETYTSAAITFDMSCFNSSDTDTNFVYRWTVEDTSGNVSTPVDFSFVCVGTNKSPIPEITNVSFPSSIPGNGSAAYGQINFVDGNAGVKYAELRVVECPAGFSCPQGTVDLTTTNPDIIYATSGTIQFSLSCQNTSGNSGYARYDWILQDLDGNRSNAWEFAFTCASAVARTQARGTRRILEGIVDTRVLETRDIGALVQVTED